MFAKSLVVFAGAGAIAGLVFGIYLIDARHAGQLVFVEGPSLSIVTEKSDFKKGEHVKIRIVNSGTVPLTFSDAAYGLRITGLSGMPMYEPVLVPEAAAETEAASELGPREEAEFVWDQIKNDGEQVLEGLYKIRSEGEDPHGNGVKKSVTVTIWK